LTRCLTAYIYNPLVLWLTRRRLSKGRAGFSSANPTIGGFVSLLAAPTLITMFVSGLWHGAGYGFVLWGLIHGFYLTVNHGWRAFAVRRWRHSTTYEALMKPTGMVLTFISVAIAMVFFRAPTIASALDVLRGSIGLNGIMLPSVLYSHLGPLVAPLHRLGVTPGEWNSHDFVESVTWITLLLGVALACPNTLQLLAPYEPALGVKPRPTRFFLPAMGPLEWGPSLPWAVLVSAVAVVAVASMGGPSEFLYWQF
jgi:alginate O-acetyltransferase complex protein AlgI